MVTIGVDARCLAGQPTGVGRYVHHLVRAMAAIDPSVRFRLYLPAGRAEIPPGERIEAAILGRISGLPDNVFTWTHVRLPAHLARHPVDLLHGTHYTLPALCPVPAVVTLHDITFDLHPEWYTRRARLSFGGFAGSSARKARHVLTVSECSRKDIISSYGVDAAKVTSVPLAPDPRFRPVTEAGELARVRERYRLGEPYVLHVGSITPRRNIGRLLDAFAGVRRGGGRPTLVLAGRVEPPSPPVEADIRRRGLADAVRVAGYVDGGDLPALYSGAAVVAYPSLYEGFGLPVIEAMACGVPVLASSGSCFPEVAGDAALLVDPEDTGAIESGLRSLLTDEPLRRKLIERGFVRAASFTWERAARETLAVYDLVLGRTRAGVRAAKHRGHAVQGGPGA